MRLRDRRVALWLNAAGTNEKIAEYAGSNLQTEPWVDVLDEDERGLWVRTTRPGAKHAALIRWEYVALVEVQLGSLEGQPPTKGKGLRE